MLHLPLKGTSEAQLQNMLFRFVETAYSTEQAEEHRKAFGAVHALRERARQLTLSEKGAEETVRTLARYYRQLTTMRSRFGTAVDECESPVEFKWRDAFRHGDKCALSDFQYERACVGSRAIARRVMASPSLARPAWRRAVPRSLTRSALPGLRRAAR